MNKKQMQKKIDLKKAKTSRVSEYLQSKQAENAKSGMDAAADTVSMRVIATAHYSAHSWKLSISKLAATFAGLKHKQKLTIMVYPENTLKNIGILTDSKRLKAMNLPNRPALQIWDNRRCSIFTDDMRVGAVINAITQWGNSNE